MEYWVMGNKEKAKQYSASFAALGYDVSDMYFEFKNWIYYTVDGVIHSCCNETLPSILEDHPRYQKLPLIKQKFEIGERVVYADLIGTVEDVNLCDGVFEYRVGSTHWFKEQSLRLATASDFKRLIDE